MPEQPFYKICEYCGHYLSTATSKEKKQCTRYPTYVDREPDDTCGEWVCARCWIPWDMVLQSEKEPKKMGIVDHTKCPEINLDIIPLDLSKMEEM